MYIIVIKYYFIIVNEDDIERSINMSLEVNFNPQEPQGSNRRIEKFKQREGKIETIFNSDGSKIERHYDKSGSLFKEAVFKDVNGDGKEDIYSVTNFYKSNDGKSESKTFIDHDGDGFDDETVTKEYDKNGQLKKETRYKEENINEVKKRNHLEHEIYNRRMDVHNDGVFMMSGPVYMKGLE